MVERWMERGGVTKYNRGLHAVDPIHHSKIK